MGWKRCEKKEEQKEKEDDKSKMHYKKLTHVVIEIGDPQSVTCMLKTHEVQNYKEVWKNRSGKSRVGSLTWNCN